MNQRKVGWDLAADGSLDVVYSDMTTSEISKACNTGSGESTTVTFEYGIKDN